MFNRLKILSNKRPIGLVCGGPSLEKFIERRDDILKSRDWYWGVINHIGVAKDVLGRVPDFIVSGDELDDHFSDVSYAMALVNRGDGNNTLFGFLNGCIQSGIEIVVLFGADGYVDELDMVCYGRKVDQRRNDLYIRDTIRFNKMFPKDHKSTRIINVSANSKYEALARVSYDQFLGDSGNSIKKRGRPKKVVTG